MIPRSVYERSLLHLLAPVRAFLEDDSVSEVLINGPNQIFVERRGVLERTDARFDGEEALLAVLRNAAQFAGKHIDAESPILESRLPDGSRLSGVLPPLATSGPYLCIRRFFQTRLTSEGLVCSGTLTEQAVAALSAMVRGKLNIVVAGGTGTGKTSLLNWLTGFVPDGERVGVIEDAEEVQPQHGHVFQLAARQADEDGRGAVSIRDLFRASLRMRPDRVIVGEIRGGEALDMVQAMVSGHGGCLATLHASHPRDVLTRLETMAMASDIALPLTALRLQIGSGVDAIVQLSRQRSGRRVVTHIVEVLDYDANAGSYELRDLFCRAYGENENEGGLVRTGAAPRFAERLIEHGARWPWSEGRSA
ncbi:MAG TPA: ATPase, T2SS/T4P/T4SS family [Polyangiales bacterium]|nr:ATPase, T2SS/T4P/T4SS family [Polyangiales bacterium]